MPVSSPVPEKGNFKFATQRSINVGETVSQSNIAEANRWTPSDTNQQSRLNRNSFQETV